MLHIIMRWPVPIAGLCVVLAMNGCSPRPAVVQTDLPGRYQVRYEPYSGWYAGTEVLILRSDMTFRQVFTDATGRVSRNNGTWRLFRGDFGYWDIDLIGAKRYVDSGHRLATPPAEINESLGVSKHGSHIRFMIDEDLDLYYTKVN
jgi:hypothetical protein